MRNRIKIQQIERQIDRLNALAGTPPEPYRREGGKFVANANNYHWSGAYGGYKLEQMCNDGGGTRDVFRQGYMTKRELYNALDAMLIGMGETGIN